MMNEAMMIMVVNRTEKMKPRLRPRSMHLAAGDEPDAAGAAHRRASTGSGAASATASMNSSDRRGGW